MNGAVLSLPGNERLVAHLAHTLGLTSIEVALRRFPDGEWYVRVLGDVKDRDVAIVCSLDQPDDKLLALYLLASTLRDLGAGRVVLVAPYLAYMRQDLAFKPGEGVSARYIGRWLSGFLDGVITVDPHLHRIHALGEVYRIATETVAAAPAIATWIRSETRAPLLVGPDAESEQWVADIAGRVGCPFVILEKKRLGDRQVEISVPDIARWRERTPVLVDDIISTAHTMITATARLRDAGLAPPVCVGVHALFCGNAYDALSAAGVARIVSCNTVSHPSNAIDLYPDIAGAVQRLLSAETKQPGMR